MCGMEYEFFNFLEDAAVVGRQAGAWRRTPLTPGMFGYSLLRGQSEPPLLRGTVSTTWRRTACRSKACHTETGAPAVYEAAILYSEALEAGRPRRALQDRREGNRAAPLRHHAELHGENGARDYPGCSGHVHTVIVGRKEETSSTTGQGGAPWHEA